MDSPHLPKLAIVVVNYGSHELLRSNLVPLSLASPESIVVVVDNYSTDAEREAVRELASEQGWLLETPAGNLGFGGGMNLGVAAAQNRGATAYFLVNPDATIDVDSLGVLRAACLRSPMTLFAPKILRPDGSIWFNGADLYLETGETRSAAKRNQFTGQRKPWLTGACLMISEALWRKVAGFDERYFLYWEDVDLSFKVIAAGGALEVLDTAVAVHDEGGTHADTKSQDRAKSSVYYYYNVRNRLLFAALQLPTEQVQKWKRSAIPAAYAVLLRGGRRQFLEPRRAWRTFYAGVSGTRDGLRLVRQVSKSINGGRK